MKPLKVLFKFENYFAIKTVYFQVSLDAGGYFFAQEVFEFEIFLEKNLFYENRR